MRKKQLITALGFLSGNPKSKSGPADENPKWLGLVALGVAFAACGAVAETQQSAKIPKIGWFAVRPASAAYAIESFQREFSKLGFVEGKNIAFEYRYAE